MKHDDEKNQSEIEDPINFFKKIDNHLSTYPSITFNTPFSKTKVQFNNLLEKPNLLLMSLKSKFYLMMGLVLSYFTSIYVVSNKVFF